MHAAELELWGLATTEQRSATLSHVFERAGVTPSEALLASYSRAWEPHTYIDPDAPALLGHLRERGIKVGVLSNTFWPRDWHEEIFRRDGVLGLIDGAVYTSEIDWTKPHPEAFRAAMTAVGVTDPEGCVFVGDRPFDDVHGAQRVGMRAVLVPNSDVPAHPGRGTGRGDQPAGRAAAAGRPLVKPGRPGRGTGAERRVPGRESLERGQHVMGAGREELCYLE